MLILFQVKSGMYLNKDDSDHADYQLGTRQSCFTDVGTCTQFSFAFWVKITEPCPHQGGIMVGRNENGGVGSRTEGFQIYCYDTNEIW